MSYQQLDTAGMDGLLQNTLEQFEGVPDGTRMDDPHHMQFYDKSGSSWDNFGHQGDSYPYGLMGGPYDVGDSAADALGMYPLDSQSPPLRENYEGKDDSFEVLDKIENFEPITSNTANGWKQYHPFLVLGLIVILYITFDMWAVTAQKFIVQYVHSGNKVPWKKMGTYAAGMTAFFLLLTWIMEIPVWIFE